jgi:hypothetical protein
VAGNATAGVAVRLVNGMLDIRAITHIRNDSDEPPAGTPCLPGSVLERTWDPLQRELFRKLPAAMIGLIFFAALAAAAQTLGTVAVGSSSGPAAVPVTFATGGTLSSIAVSTQGVASLDFMNAGGGTCAPASTYTQGQSCTVRIGFTPIAAGLRVGAVTLTDGSGALLGTAYIYGTGQAPLLVYNPSTQTVLYTGLNAPQSMVVDAASNLFIADTGNARVVEIPWNGTGYGAPVNVGTGFSAPSGVAVDGAGNVYVADASLNQIIEVPWTGNAYGAQFALAGTYDFAQDITIDGSGDLFILAGTSVTELPWNGSSYDAPVSIGSGLSNGQYSTEFVDNSGNIYIADYMNGNIVKETPSGGSYTQTILGSFGAQSVDGVATDPAGDVYISNYEAGSVLMLPWTGSGYGTQITLTSNGPLSGPGAIYLDGTGNVYIEDFNNNLLAEWSVSNPPTLSFNTATDVGSTDAADGAQAVSLLNTGNAPLSIAVPAIGMNPSIASGFSYDAASTCPQLSPTSAPATLDSAATCTYALDFVPIEPGVNSGAMVLTDNHLGAVSATQTIGLNGTGISEVAKLAFQTAPASPIDLTQNAGSSVIVAEEKSNSAVDTYANDVIALTVTGPNSYTQMYRATAVSGLSTFNLSGAALITAGSYTYTASLSGVTSAIASETVNNTLAQTISFAPSSPITYGTSPVMLIATGGNSGNPVTFSILSGDSAGALSGPNNNVLTVTGAGTIVIAVNQAGNGSYSAAAQVTASIIVNKAAQSINFAPLSPITYGVPPITLMAIGGGSGNTVTFSITSGASYGALSGLNNSVLTVTGAGTIVIAADQAGNDNYSAATESAASIIVNKAAQSIMFAPTSPVTYGASPITLTATGGASGTPVIFSILSGAASGALSGINNSVLTITGTGTIVITADQAGNSNYSAAAESTASIIVNKAAQTIGFAPASPLTYGVSPITLTAVGGSSGNPVTFSILSGGSFGVLSGISNSLLTVTGAGTLVIAADQAANSDYAAATQVTASIVVNKASQAISFAPASPVTYGVSPITLTATGGASGIPVTFSILSGETSGELSGVNNSVLTIIGAGTIVIAANQAANSDYAAAPQVTASIVVNKDTQTISFTPASPVTYGVSPITLHATGGASGNAVTFSIVSGGSNGSLSGVNSSVLTVTGAGTIVIAADQAGNGNYSVATQTTASITVNKAAQTINFTAASQLTFGVAPITLTATGGESANPVIFSILTGSAFGTLSGGNNSLLTVTGTGTIVIAANQLGNGNYSAATPVTASIMIAKASQTIMFNPASPVTYGVTSVTLSGTGGNSGEPVTFTVLSGPGTLSGPDSSTLTVTGAGTIVIAANQPSSINYLAATEVTASIAVNKASQVITFTPPSPLTYGVAPITLSATGGPSGNAVTFTCVSGPCALGGMNNSTLTVTGAGTIVIAANQPGAANYSSAPQATASIVIGKLALVSQAHSASAVYGTPFPTFTGSLTGVVAGDGISVSYSTTATPTSRAGGLYSITATLNDPESRLGNYLVTNTPATLTITQAPLTVTVNSASSVYGAAFPVFTGSLSGVVPGDGITATYSSAATPTSPIGSNYPITASLNDPNNKLSNYTISNVPGSLSIAPAALAVAVNPASSVYGAPLPAFTGSLTGVVPGDGITASYSTTATPTSTPGGSYRITATLDDPNNKIGNYGVTVTPGQLTITKAVSTTTLLSGANPVLLSTSIPLTVTVLSPVGMPTGIVNFLDSATLLGSAPLLNGTASLAVSTLTAGSHMLIATYSGDANFAEAASGVLTQTVVEITASAGEGSGSSNNTSQIVSASGSATFSLSILPTSGVSFPTATVLTLTGMPAGATTTVSPTSWAQNSSTTWTLPANSPLSNVSITIQLPAGTAHVDVGPRRGKILPLLWALLLTPCMRRMRRTFKWQMQTMLLILLAIGGVEAAAISGCGSSSRSVVSPVQVYTINETLSVGTQAYAATLTLTVE